jgi:4,5-DOPA dioxygenase extradiol
MPAVFIGHGNPMYAITENDYASAWAALGEALPVPRAIVSVSAHWFVPELAVTSMPMPRTIHDFGGFLPELYKVQYPAPGDERLAQQIAGLLEPEQTRLDGDWGLDHGTWAVLRHIFPKAEIPVVQLSIHRQQPAQWHFDLARRLGPLRDEGVLILGSGNIVHNLRAYAWKEPHRPPFDWAQRFDATVRDAIDSGNTDRLIDYERLGSDAAMAVPTPEHYLPLLYVLAQRREDEATSFPVEGFDGGSMSMLSVRVG